MYGVVRVAGTVLLSPHTLAEIVGRFGARPDPRREDTARFPLCRCSAAAQAEGSDQAGAFEIEILDLSLRGLGFRTTAPVAPGTVLSVLLKIPGLPVQTWRCRVTAIHGHQGQHCHGGAQFEAINTH